MRITQDLYSGSMALLTDLYQLTMAYGYWKAGMKDLQSVFHLFFREHPFHGGYTVACGLEYIVDYLNNFCFTDDDLAYLATLKGSDGERLFEDQFLAYLSKLDFSCDIDAVPEGTAVFPHQPLLRVKGPILQAQILETPLLNIINFQSLIATKSARINMAARGEPVLEFGLRRAQGIDGGLAASRAAFIGGCSSTSNVLAGKLFNIPVAGTHAHSWVMAFPSELASFEAYARVMPNNCVFLVDTYNTLEGINHAIAVGKKLREQGKKLLGVRIDSGDLAYFSIKARKMLDEAGFTDTNIVASNDLDENLVESLKLQDAKINVWGIGTKLVTAFDQPALGAVYKLSGVHDSEGHWQYKIKLSEQAIKVNNPGIQQVRRFRKNGEFVTDMIYNEPLEKKEKYLIIDPADSTRRKKIKTSTHQSEELLVPIFRNGQLVYQLPDINAIKQRVKDQLKSFDRSVKRLVNPHIYPVGLEEELFHLKTELILKLRKIQD